MIPDSPPSFMMSGIEVVGAIASSSQLVRYLIEIIEYTRSISNHIKESSCPFQQYRRNLESLLSTVTAIVNTPYLQTDSVRDHLDTLEARAKSLKTTLQRYPTALPQKAVKRFWTALLAQRSEAQIVRDFTALERDKSNLLLCITTSFGGVLHDINKRTNSDLMATQNNIHRKVTNRG